MQSQGNIRVVEMLRYLYQHTDENHPATVTDITAYLKERGIQAVRQTVYTDLNALKGGTSFLHRNYHVRHRRIKK